MVTLAVNVDSHAYLTFGGLVSLSCRPWCSRPQRRGAESDLRCLVASALSYFSYLFLVLRRCRRRYPPRPPGRHLFHHHCCCSCRCCCPFAAASKETVLALRVSALRGIGGGGGTRDHAVSSALDLTRRVQQSCIAGCTYVRSYYAQFPCRLPCITHAPHILDGTHSIPRCIAPQLVCSYYCRNHAEHSANSGKNHARCGSKPKVTQWVTQEQGNSPAYLTSGSSVSSRPSSTAGPLEPRAMAFPCLALSISLARVV